LGYLLVASFAFALFFQVFDVVLGNDGESDGVEAKVFCSSKTKKTSEVPKIQLEKLDRAALNGGLGTNFLKLVLVVPTKTRVSPNSSSLKIVLLETIINYVLEVFIPISNFKI